MPHPASIRFFHAVKRLAAAALLLLLARPAAAFPIFARKYETSCQTCHTVFPKLNPFGQAFRLKGYRMPKETEEMVKVKQINLGADANKRLWPKAIWPSDLPGGVPVALNIKMEGVYSATDDHAGTRTVVHEDLQFPQEVNLFAAGTMGDHVSFMTELTHAENSDASSGVEIEHARIDFDNLFGPDTAFNIRLGKFAPNLYDGFQEMWISTDNGIDALFSYNPVGLNGGNSLDDSQGVVALPARVRGLEAYGVLNHRLFWTVGVATKLGPGQQVPDRTTTPATQSPNGNFNNSANKDLYARIDWKFGGMGLDGDTEGVVLPPENWRETSLRIGVLGLTGNGKNIFTDVSGALGSPGFMQDASYTRLGLFASVIYGDLNLFGVAIHGKDNLQLLDGQAVSVISETPFTYDAWFTQADYVFTPTFLGSLRYEKLRQADRSAEPRGFRFFNASFTYAVLANLKLMVEYRKDYNAVQPTTTGINTILRVAF